MSKSNVSKTYLLDSLFSIFNYVFNFIFAIICIYPFYYLLLVSISDSDAVYRGDVVLWPKIINLSYYKEILALPGIGNAFFISISRTVIGTAITIIFSSMIGYVLTKKEFKYRKPVYRLIIFTMYANSGLIPWVVTLTFLGLRNSFLLYILPSAVNAFGMVMIKTYVEQMPASIEESAIVDGARYFTIYYKIIIPLAKPVIAAVAVLVAIWQWNTWTDNFFLARSPRLETMQLMLYNYLQGSYALATAAASGGGKAFYETMKLSPPNPFTIKCTIAVVTTIPVMLFYPFLQKYFVKGIMVGAIKG